MSRQEEAGSKYRAGELLKRFLPYYRKYWKIVVIDLLCAGLTTICEMVLPMIMRYITNTGMNDLAALSVHVILRLAALYLVLRMIDTMANFYMAYTGHVMGTRMETDMRRDAYAHLQKLSDTYYNNTKVGQIMGRITNDLFDVTEFSHHCPEEFFIAAIKAVISFIILSRINIALTLIIFAVVPVMIVTCTIINLRLRSAFRRQRVQIGELNARIEDSLLGQKVVKAFTNEEKEKAKFEEDNQKFFQIKKETYKFMAAFGTTTRAFDGVMYLIIVAAGGIFMVKELISPGDLVAYVMYVGTLIATIRRIIEFAEQFQRGINIRAGEKIAIVGPSGGGKTTLCNLIPRFYNIDEGEIILDGENIRHYTVQSLRRNIGMVQQDVYLFSGTVYENIAYGREGADRQEVIEAAKRAGAHEFIEMLKDGYDTYVGERGVKLSGGQKQRISIARVFLKNPPILILDEATSALDNESEFQVAKSLQELAKGRTTITIAHRLSSIRNSDRILVLTDEGIMEEGNHEQLLEKRGIYYHFYTTANELK
ncbi:MAG: ABC transporter ATP-binding protein [Lachnospiraceae bacterium]|nr:ABC transporter ATP-binding protein [Lachnospiraceae bacterium]